MGNLSIVHYLRETYPAMDCSRMNSSGLQPLHVACEKGMLHVVMYLVNNRLSDASACTADGRNALHMAASSNHISLLQFLCTIMPPEALRAAESRGFSPLHLACMLGHDEAVNLLIHATGVDVNQLDRLGRTCTDMAIILGHLGVVRSLLSLPPTCRPNIDEQHGMHAYTGLHWACANLQYSIIKYLVQDRGANVTAKDINGLTPDKVVSDPVVTLLVTGSVSKKEMRAAVDSIRDFRLTENGVAGVTTKQKSKVSKSSQRQSHTRPESGDECSDDEQFSDEGSEGGESAEDGGSESGEEGGSVSGDNEVMPEDHDSSREISDRGRSGSDECGSEGDESGVEDSVLFEWVKHESNIEKLEAELGATPDILCDVREICNDKTGETLLHEACKHPYLPTVQYLVEGLGADVNAVDNRGWTSLHNAVCASHVVVVKYLVKYAGAVLDIKDKNGKTPLDLCANGSPHSDEIKKTITKSLSKPPEKRTKVAIPTYSGGH